MAAASVKAARNATSFGKAVSKGCNKDYWLLVAGGLLAAGGCWWLVAAGGCWWLVAAGDWWLLVAGGCWWLLVAGGCW